MVGIRKRKDMMRIMSKYVQLKEEYIEKIDRVNELQERIDKAIDLIKTIVVHFESERPITEVAINFKHTKEGQELLDILRGYKE